MKKIGEGAAFARPTKTKILVFGEGNFLRAFVGVLAQRMNDNAAFDGGVMLLQGLPEGMGERIEGQDGLYTVIERGKAGGEVIDRAEVVRSVLGCHNPYADYAGFLAMAENPDLQMISSNTTEFGICYDAGEKKGEEHANYPAKLTDFLYRRYTFFGGTEESGLLILPCELIDRNGDKLKEIVLRYAAEWRLGEDFSAWLERACVFGNTLVDRIVSGYPKAEADEICGKLGYCDQLLDVCEPFFLWVIEGAKDKLARIPFEKSGLEVVLTDNMEPYRTRKVRVLNGAHTSSVLAGALCGFETVEQIVNDAAFRPFMEGAVYGEILKTFKGKDLRRYAEEVFERFENPFLNHRLLSIALNSVSKWKTRVLPSVRDYAARFGQAPDALAFSFAALFAFYRKGEGVKDEARYADALSGAKDAADALSLSELWDEDLNAIPGMAEKVRKYADKIEESGVYRTVREIGDAYQNHIG